MKTSHKASLPKQFAKQLLHWYQQYGRHDLPWQKRPTPYRVWISEIMLQQTQVKTVIPFYIRFMQRFPSLKSLALADIDEVLAHWSGLGYYARARNLHRCALIVYHDYKGRFPKSVKALAELPGIGLSTAGAIASFTMQIPATILDGNVKRVLTRYHAIAGWPGNSKVLRHLWEIAKAYTPAENYAAYNQAMMDLGATICTRHKPRCADCPLQKNCLAHLTQQTGDFPGKKPSSKRPNKQTTMLILQNAQAEILLQRRPPLGIWGGLWCFPEASSKQDIKKLCQQWGYKVLNSQQLPIIIHQFSHFTLEITPVLIKIKPQAQRVLETPPQVWYKASRKLPGGIPKPVAQLLAQI